MTRGVYLAFAVLTLLSVTFAASMSWYLSSAPPCTIPESKISDFAKEGISVYNEMNKFLISATLIIAGFAGGLILAVIKDGVALSVYSICILFSVFALSSVGVYFGYVSFSGILESVINSCIDVSSDRLLLPQLIQYYSMMAAFLGGVCVIVIELSKRTS